MLGSNTNTSMPAEDFRGWVQGPDTRGSLDIIWSCVAVLVTALWTVLHLNIPATGDGLRHLMGRKFRWGCASILAPDFLTLVAASQWDAARKSVADMHEIREVKQDNTRWCMEHAFYANSGGFLLKCPDLDAFPVDADAIHYLVCREYIKLPTITRDEVWDKSKADLFAKAATVIQSTWLIIGSIGRAASHLPLCPMETFTLAFIVSTVMSYFFWWRKPQNVETPTVVICEHTIAHIRRDAGFGDDTWERSPLEFICAEKKKWKRRAMFEAPLSEKPTQFADPEDKPSSIPHTPSGVTILDRVGTAKTVSSMFSSKTLTARVDTDDTVVSKEPQRQPPARISDDAILPCGLSPVVLMSVALPSMIHSAIHLLGWNFEYPTYAEKQVWRTAAVLLNVMAMISVAGVRALALLGYKGRFNLIFIWINHVPESPTGKSETLESRENGEAGRFWQDFAFWDLFLSFTTFCLLVARFAIITEVIISFRSLPKNVFITVNWSDFIPHI